MKAATPIVLIPCAETNWESRITLPKLDDNVFSRIIRNPHPNSTNPKERECTEMLCALLRNSSIVQQHVLKYFASILGQHDLDWNDLEFEYLTEQSIGSKRDDLRIMGWKATDDGLQLSVLWTIEVKVGSTFHESSSIVVGDVEIVDDVEVVNQVINYDHWLAAQPAEYLGGIVLSLSNSAHLLPDALRCTWACTSWTRLGNCIAEALDEQGVTESERFLAKHVLGFIRNYLWRASEMETTKVGFDDIALLRAFTAYGLDLEKKIDGLVAGLRHVVAEFGFESDSFSHMKRLYKPSAVSVLYRDFIDKSISSYPELNIGVEEANATLWLETAPENVFKKTIIKTVQEVLPALRDLNSNWQSNDEGWWDLVIEMPLHSLLFASDQEAAFQDFFRRALSDLVTVNLAERLTLAIKSDIQAV